VNYDAHLIAFLYLTLLSSRFNYTSCGTTCLLSFFDTTNPIPVKMGIGSSSENSTSIPSPEMRGSAKRKLDLTLNHVIPRHQKHGVIAVERPGLPAITRQKHLQLGVELLGLAGYGIGCPLLISLMALMISSIASPHPYPHPSS